MRAGWCAAVLWVSPVLAADEGVVEVTGEANVTADKVATKNAAVADAMKKAIEQVVGISVKSEFSQLQSESTKNEQTEFISKVRDQLTQQAEGFIQKYDVLDSSVKDGVMYVKIKAVVSESKLKAEVKKLGQLIQAAGNPKLMLAIQDVVVTPEGKKDVINESFLAAYLEQELLARGFELRGKGAARGVVKGDADAYTAWLQDTENAALVARGEGADFLIAGQVEILDKGEIKDTGGLAALEGQRSIEIKAVIRGINTASGEVMSTKPVQTKSMGSDIERAMHRAFKGKGDNVVKKVFTELLRDLKENFKKAAEQGQSYVVELKGIASFRKQGQGFLELLKGLSGVNGVKQKSFNNGELVVDVAFKGSPAELQERIFAAAEANGLSELDIEGVSGKRLTFAL